MATAATTKKPSVSAFLNTRDLKNAKASGVYQKLMEGEYLVKLTQAKFGETRKKVPNFTVAVEIATTTNEHPTMQPGRSADVYVGDASNDSFLPNVKAVVEAVFGLFGITPETIAQQTDEEFENLLDEMFMEDQSASGCYLYARAVAAKKTDPKTGQPYINTRFSTPKLEHFVAAGITPNPEWVGVVAGEAA